MKQDKKSKRILLILPRLHTNLDPILHALKSKNFELSALCLSIWDKIEVHDLVNPEKIRISLIFKILNKIFPNIMRNNFNYPGLIYSIYKLLIIKPTLIIVREPYLPFAISFIIASIILKKRVIVYTQWSFEQSRENIPLYMVLNFINNYFKINFYTTVPPIKNTYEKLFNNFYYIPFAMPVRGGKIEYFKDNKINILIVAKMQKRKRIEDVLNALALLNNKFDLSLLIISKKFDKNYEAVIFETIKNNGLSEITEIKMDVPFREMNKYYEYSDLFIFPSEDEPCGISHLEAMSYGLALIITNENPCGRYATKYNCALSYRVGDIHTLSKHIDYLSGNRDKIIEMGKLSRDIVKSNHDPQVIVKELLSLADIQID